MDSTYLTPPLSQKPSEGNGKMRATPLPDPSPVLTHHTVTAFMNPARPANMTGCMRQGRDCCPLKWLEKTLETSVTRTHPLTLETPSSAGPKEVPTDPSNALWSRSKTPRARRGGPFRSHVPGRVTWSPTKLRKRRLVSLPEVQKVTVPLISPAPKGQPSNSKDKI